MTPQKESLLSEVSSYETPENLKGPCGFLNVQITNSHWGLHYNRCLRNRITVKASLSCESSGVTPEPPLKSQPNVKQ